MCLKLLLKYNVNLLNSFKTQNRHFSALSINLHSGIVRQEPCTTLFIKPDNGTGTSKTVNRLQSRHASGSSFIDLINKLSESSFVVGTQEALISIHNTTGMPWWLTIVATTISARLLITFPLAIYQHRVIAKLENLKWEFKEMAEEMKYEAAFAKKKFNLTEQKTHALYRLSLRKQWRNLILRDNCHPFKASLLLWVQIPLWISLSFSIRNLIYTNHVTKLEMSTEGFGWITNLTDVDHLWILPIVFGITNLTIIMIQNHSKIRTPSKIQTGLTIFFSGFSILMIPLAASIPSSLCLYWLTSSGFGLVQNFILISPKFRRTVGIPNTPSEHEHPYEHLKRVLLKKLRLKISD